MEDKKQISKEALERFKKELEYLKNVKRREIAEELRHAISFGDLKENAAYHEAKDAQAFLEGKIIELDRIIKESVVIESVNHSGIVVVGSQITALVDGEKEKYSIVNGKESDPLNNKISAESPMGESFLGRKKDQEFLFKAPSGDEIKIKILEIL
jgi:transcription elongation factor GreA